MPDNTITEKNRDVFERLKRLFSSTTVTKQVGKRKLKVKDLDTRQSYPQTNFVDKYKKMYTTMSGASTGWGSTQNENIIRFEKYKEYELMDRDALVSSVLDLYSEEAATDNESGEVLKINCENENIYEILHNLFYDIINIEFNLSMWTRSLCKYGDTFLALELSPKYGIINVLPLSVYELEREENYDEDNPHAVRFNAINDVSILGRRTFDNFEIIHFRLMTDNTILPYGKSMIESSRNTWKQVQLMEEAMLIYRIMRAPERRVFYIDTGNLPPEDVDSFMQKVITKIKKAPIIDSKTGEYNLRFNVVNVTEDFFFPVRGDSEGTKVDTLPGGQNTSDIEDIEYLQKKLFASWRIPKSFLSYEEELGQKCIALDTKIPLLNGKIKTLSELIDDYNNGITNWVYSINENNEIVPGEIEWAGQTRLNAEVVEVTLDNGRTIVTTPDHLFYDRDGNTVFAENLINNMSLMPLYIKNEKIKGRNATYRKVYNPAKNKYEWEHHIVSRYFIGETDFSKGYVIHHKDFNKENNNPDNLIRMKIKEHTKLHANLPGSPQYEYLHSQRISEVVKKMWKNPNHKEKVVTHPNFIAGVRHGGVNAIKVRKKTWTKEQWRKMGKNVSQSLKVSKKWKDYQDRRKKNKIGYKAAFISEEMLINAAATCKNFAELSNMLNISPPTLKKVFENYNINRHEFIVTYMPLGVSNKGFYNNFIRKNHKVINVKLLETRQDTGDLTIKQHHNFGIDAGIIIHNSTLALEDIRFSRTIQKIQKTIVAELEKMAIIHLYIQGFRDEELLDFELELTNPSTLHEQQKLELLQTKISAANEARDSEFFSKEWIYENILNISEDERKRMFAEQIVDEKNTLRLNQIGLGNDPAKTNKLVSGDSEDKDSGPEYKELGITFNKTEDEETSESGEDEFTKLDAEIKSSIKNAKVNKRSLGYKPTIKANKQLKWNRHKILLREEHSDESKEKMIEDVESLITELSSFVSQSNDK